MDDGSKHRWQQKVSKNVASDVLEGKASDYINAMTGTGDRRFDLLTSRRSER